MLLMKRIKLTHPLVLGFAANLAFAILVVASGVSWGFDPGEIVIAFATVMIGGGIGGYLAWQGTKGLRRRP